MILYVVLEAYDWEEDSTLIKAIFDSNEKAEAFSKSLDTNTKTNWIEEYILNNETIGNLSILK